MTSIARSKEAETDLSKDAAYNDKRWCLEEHRSKFGLDTHEFLRLFRI